MSRKKMPTTSLDAYASLQPDQIRAIYQKIVEALKVLGSASTEQISDYTTIKHDKIWKRVSEMQTLGIIYRPGNKVLTRSKRSAFVWCLCNNQPKVERPQEKALKGDSVSDYSRKLIPTIVQVKMF